MPDKNYKKFNIFNLKKSLIILILLFLIIKLNAQANNNPYTGYILKDVLLEAPFTTQAPFGEWNDPRQQDACEEASVLIASKWYTKDMNLTKEEARTKMLDMVNFQKKLYNSYIDTSAKDTAERLLKAYFGIKNWQVKKVDSYEDIIREIMKKNLLIIPMNGRLLNNPHFTQPAPLRHMLVVIGYDASKEEVITHDPGIGLGKHYRYPVKVLYNAIRDYKTGNHEPIVGNIKNIIVVYAQETGVE